MKRFEDFSGNSRTGGAPFYSEDFHDTQAEIYTALVDMLENLTGGVSCVLSGGVITGASPYNISAAVVFLTDGAGNRDIYRLPAQAGVTAGTKYLKADTDVETTRTYDDASVQPVLIEKRATVSGTTGSGEQITFNPATDTLPVVRINNENINDATIQSDKIAAGQLLKVVELAANTELYIVTIEIGAWDMDADQTKVIDLSAIAIPPTNKLNFRMAEAMIKRDDSSFYQPLHSWDATANDGTINGGYSLIGTTSLTLYRKTGGSFDGTNYNDTGINRGYVTVIFEE